MTEQPPPAGGNPPPPPPPQGGYPPPPPPGAYQPPYGYPPPQAGAYPQGYPAMRQGLGALPPEAYTPWIRRVGAALIDVLPALIVIAIVEAIFLGIAFGTAQNSGCVTDAYGNPTECTTNFTGFGVFCLIMAEFLPWLLALAWALWNLGYRQGMTGSSIGKSVLKFKVVSETTGAPIGFGMSVLRQIAHVVDAAICYVGYLFPLWDPKRQTLADKIMSTVCLPTEGAAPGSPT